VTVRSSSEQGSGSAAADEGGNEGAGGEGAGDEVAGGEGAGGWAHPATSRTATRDRHLFTG